MHKIRKSIKEQSTVVFKEEDRSVRGECCLGVTRKIILYWEVSLQLVVLVT